MMMRVSPSVMPPEHWLTLMTCVICDRTPDTSPIYKCNYGHTMCYACFQNLLHEEAIPVCPECSSEQFTRHDVSDDFLRKLKNKPGIGRPCRYNLKTPLPTQGLPTAEELITVEELFQMPAGQMKQLFEDCTREKLLYLNKLQATETLAGKLASRSNSFTKNGNKDTMEKLVDTPHSRKPLRCPHDNCRKIIAISAFKAHFKYEHFDFKRFHVEHGQELSLPFDTTLIQHGKTICLGIVTVYRNDDDQRTLHSDSISTFNNTKQSHPFWHRNELDTFWLMVSGSNHAHPGQAFLILWLFTNNDEETYNCTLELTSVESVITMTTFCKVNKIYESQTVEEVARSQNCLYLAYCTVKSMLMYGPGMMIRLTIH